MRVLQDIQTVYETQILQSATCFTQSKKESMCRKIQGSLSMKMC